MQDKKTQDLSLRLSLSKKMISNKILNAQEIKVITSK